MYDNYPLTIMVAINCSSMIDTCTLKLHQQLGAMPPDSCILDALAIASD